ncbi:MAG: c-type cytochrome [Polyangiaceae bacterium]|nr:c-type cytochrome [Polyangiaceae bacterium]MCW5789378.1 c-type cytochrome [Polyangiaceae bacterium]
MSRDKQKPDTSPEPRGEVTDDLLEHEYDGIREYDNPLPRWWVWMFWGSFWFSVLYFFHYHVGGQGTSVAQAYVEELQIAREEQAKASLGEAVTEQALAKMMADTALMADTESLYAQRCAQCHADKGQGLIGPNLTDDHYVHGGTLMEIYQVVAHGVLAKGMPEWERQLTPIELRKIVAYVGSMRGTNVAGKAPEGNQVGLAALLEAAKDGAAPPSGAAAPSGAAPGGAPSAEAPTGEVPAPSGAPSGEAAP